MWLLMIWKKNLWHWLTVFYVLIVFHVGISGQIEEKLATDTTNVDSTSQSLKMILEKGDTTLLIPVDSLTGLIPVDSLTDIPQKKKTVKSDRNPKKAWWYSAILPGLGQAYNRKHWKIPIIYTVFLGTYYMIGDNNFKYNKYKNAYADFAEVKAPPSWASNATEAQLKDRKDFFRRNRDLGIILGVMMYLMNIIDASVDANLMDFDISDDLSMSVRPDVDHLIVNQKNTFGLKFVITLNK